MKRITLTLFVLFILLAPGLYAVDSPTTTVLDAKQVAKIDFSGKWSGKRMQYSWDKTTFVETFQYEFDLKQEGDIVTGTSTIITSNGEYADMKLEGVVVGNKLHFHEYEVSNAIRPEGKVWCFKTGELQVVKDGDNLKLQGATSSFMETYNYPCSGGYTDLTKVDNSNNTVALSQLTVEGTNTNNGTAPAITIGAYPNPFIDNSTISYNITADSKVSLEVYDISGKIAGNLFAGNQTAGSYTYNFTGKNAGFGSGVYIVKLTVNGEVYSTQLVQMR